MIVALVGAACSSSSDDGRQEPSSFEQGSTFRELPLAGYLDRNHDGILTPDEHGPLGPSEVRAAYPAAELLLVHVAFEWCKYCWEETSDQIAWTKHYGGRFVSMQVMVEDRDGRPADRSLLDRWIKNHKSALPTVLEPEATLFARFGKSATYLLLDPRDGMRVLTVGAGPPQFALVREKIRERLGPLPVSASPH